MKTAWFVALAVALGLAASAQAQVSVSDAWVRGTVQGQKAAGAFMRLKSSEGAALIAAESSVARAVEIHEMRMEGNVMRMRAVPRLDLPAGQTIELKPGGYHMMLLDLKAPLKKGEIVPIRLKLRGKDGRAEEVEVKAEVRDLAAGGQGHMKH